ncbi:hypothetical protein [Brevibacillus porteri]|uniref:hypothetical protein n=1 Tax=Brevibacillus porteri TaxID=2126350 RepID=UPI003D2538B4
MLRRRFRFLMAERVPIVLALDVHVLAELRLMARHESASSRIVTALIERCRSHVVGYAHFARTRESDIARVGIERDMRLERHVLDNSELLP